MKKLNKKLVKTEKPENKTLQWVKFAIALALYLLFLYWVKSWLGLIVIPFIYDNYITHKINWQWWRDSDSEITRGIMSWVDAIVFALVAVYFVTTFSFQNYAIPSASLEKSLLTGDYLFVSKISYGPRVPMTPLTMPMTQHTMPWGTKSYIEWPQWEYRRVSGLGKVELNDIVVFNYPSGDTVIVNPMYQNQDYYTLCYTIGKQLNQDMQIPDSLPVMEQRARFQKLYADGRSYILQNKQEFQGIMSRPVDRRENYVKRCVGLPGDMLEIKDKVVYLNGKANKEPDNVQYMYWVDTKVDITDDMAHELGIALDDLGLPNKGVYYLPLTAKMIETMKGMPEVFTDIRPETGRYEDGIYPLNGNTHWDRDNYGPVWIPAKGKSIDLTLDNIAVYERPIAIYEGNDLQIKDNKIFINGQEATSYTFKMDYYWMMGDNRHNSADSRYWGFVPEDHIVGKPIFVWLSLDKDRSLFNGGVRWNRLFKWVDDIK
ncbi:MAG: signal peptidase I [Bacteroidaceae bacterium]|nr:signal peptidase I [Bacteroidaceae bacterium]